MSPDSRDGWDIGTPEASPPTAAPAGLNGIAAGLPGAAGPVGTAPNRGCDAAGKLALADAVPPPSEPVGAVARLYVKDLTLAEVAAELGLKSPEDLRARIEADPALRRLGLGPLLQPGGRIKRAAWESLRDGNSLFQDTVVELGLGTPEHPR